MVLSFSEQPAHVGIILHIDVLLDILSQAVSPDIIGAYRGLIFSFDRCRYRRFIGRYRRFIGRYEYRFLAPTVDRVPRLNFATLTTIVPLCLQVWQVILPKICIRLSILLGGCAPRPRCGEPSLCLGFEHRSKHCFKPCFLKH